MAVSAPVRRFLMELKRRRVLRVAGIYAAAGFVVLEAVDLLAPVLLLPEWAYRVVGGLVLLCFPLAMVAAWVFDLTPGGVERTDAAAGGPAAHAPVSVPQAASALALTLVVVGVLTFGGWRFLRPPPPFGNTAAVGVLPFSNLSPDPDDAFFADGLHDELLTHLYKIGGLRVPSRTTLLRYRETDKDLPRIGEELATRYVLEGSVEPRDDHVRIRIQLIDASTDSHVWAEHYDRPMADIHAVQEEIARAIAGELRVRIRPSERRELAVRPTAELQAYEHFLRGRASVQAGFAIGGANTEAWRQEWLESERSFARAVEIDPGFARAWAELGLQRARLYWWSMADHAESIEGAGVALERARALDPDLPATLLAEAWYRQWVERDSERALESAMRAREGMPGDSDVTSAIGAALRRLGRFEEAVIRFREVADRHPTEFFWANLVWATYRAMRRFEDAERALAQWVGIVGDGPRAARARMWLAFEASGDTAALRRDREAIVDLYGPEAVGFPLDAHLFLREYDEALAFVQGLPDGLSTQDGPIPTASIRMMVHGLMGDHDAARGEAANVLAFLDDVEGRLRPAPWHGHRALALATLGQRDAALAEARKSLDLTSTDRWVGPIARQRLMYVHTILGEPDSAIDQLEFLLSAEYFDAMTVGRARVDPRLDALRGHSRFERLIAQHTSRSDP